VYKAQYLDVFMEFDRSNVFQFFFLASFFSSLVYTVAISPFDTYISKAQGVVVEGDFAFRVAQGMRAQ